MEFIKNLFETLPVTTSSLTIFLALVSACIASYLFFHFLKLMINEKAWGKEFIKANILGEKFDSLFLKEAEVYYIEHVDEYFYLKKGLIFGFQWRKGFSGGLEFSDSGEVWFTDEYGITYFDTKEAALTKAKSLKNVKTKTTKELKFSRLWLLSPLVFDILYKLFLAQPFETVLCVGTVSVFIGLRWLSGKAAENFRRTDNHEERISKLEEMK